MSSCLSPTIDIWIFAIIFHLEIVISIQLLSVICSHLSIIIAIVIKRVVTIWSSWWVSSDWIILHLRLLLVYRWSLSLSFHLFVILCNLFLSCSFLHNFSISLWLSWCFFSYFLILSTICLLLNLLISWWIFLAWSNILLLSLIISILILHHLGCSLFISFLLHGMFLSLHRIHSFKVFSSRRFFICFDHFLMSFLLRHCSFNRNSWFSWLRLISIFHFVQILRIRVILSSSILVLEIHFILL